MREGMLACGCALFEDLVGWLVVRLNRSRWCVVDGRCTRCSTLLLASLKLSTISAGL